MIEVLLSRSPLVPPKLADVDKANWTAVDKHLTLIDIDWRLYRRL